MSWNTGNVIKVSLWGESHANAIGLVIDGLGAGLKIDRDFINKELAKRRPQGSISTSRSEKDEVVFQSGVKDDITTGAPISFYIANANTHSSDYVRGDMRPSHSDYSAYVKYDGFNDYRGGGMFSGRITASLVVLGAICKQLLAKQNIKIASHIKNILNVEDDEFNQDELDKQIDELNEKYFAVLSSNKGKEMEEVIIKTKQEGDSVGGSLETVVTGLKAGIGEPYFDSVESRIAALLFSIGGVKGVSFGDGEKFSRSKGSEVNDGLHYDENKKVSLLTNHNGGITGGITNGGNIVINTIVKPTPSISKSQKSINVETKENIDLVIKGRHDPCIVHRVRSVVDALVAFALVDLILESKVKKANIWNMD